MHLLVATLHPAMQRRQRRRHRRGHWSPDVRPRVDFVLLYTVTEQAISLTYALAVNRSFEIYDLLTYPAPGLCDLLRALVNWVVVLM
jgi:hypothetical protein